MQVIRSVGRWTSIAVLGLLAMPAVRAESKLPLGQVLADYNAAWGERDAARRGALLERAWSERGTYTDPQAHVEGRAALVSHIGLVQPRLPAGTRGVIVSAPDVHHGVFRFAWEFRDGKGALFMKGEDFGELDEDGRIRRIFGFFGDLLPATKL
ncbi:hypothetical protein [Niveibacterium sp. SC-1]|uniref:hypothetical protein n=1 Tax=Niveibacterium sp. SC-1 TaxID=3135646 RepID=UPI00311E2737